MFHVSCLITFFLFAQFVCSAFLCNIINVFAHNNPESNVHFSLEPSHVTKPVFKWFVLIPPHKETLIYVITRAVGDESRFRLRFFLFFVLRLCNDRFFLTKIK